MKNIGITLFCLFLVSGAMTQTPSVPTEVYTMFPDGDYDNVTNKKIYSDSSVTTFVIWVKKNVPLHKHISHTEQVIVVEGTAIMQVGENTFPIKAGDMIVVPENIPHRVDVTSTTPLKVISIQAPEFLGDDRIFLE